MRRGSVLFLSPHRLTVPLHSSNVLLTSCPPSSGTGGLFSSLRTPPPDGQHPGVFGASVLLGIGVGVNVALLFMLVIFKLYDSYLYINKVSDRLNGSVRN